MSSVHHLETHTHKTGIAFAEKDDFSLYLVILPKSWNPNQNPNGKFSKCSATWATEKSFMLNLYENQRVELKFEGDEDNKKYVLNLLLDKVSTNQSSADNFDDYHTELIADITGRKYNSTKITDSDCVTVHNTNDIASVVSLLQLVQHSQLNTVDDTSFDRTQNPMLRPLLHYLFTKEMQTVQRYIRRGYVPTSEKVRAIRGRPDMRSVAKAQVSGGTEVLCHYDEFEESTPLMRILVTALDIVAGGNWLTQMYSDIGGSLTHSNTDEQSTDLRRTLHSIPSMSPSQALTAHLRLRLNRSTQIFARALSLAKHILQDEQIFPTQSKTLSEEAWCWDVDMSDVWESILVQGFQRCTNTNVTHYDKWCTKKYSTPNTVYEREINAPFNNNKNSNKRPDILLTHQSQEQNIETQHRWIVDAKYSYFEKVPGSPSRDHQSQMFGYLYLTKDPDKDTDKGTQNKPWATHLALIYTTDTATMVNPTSHDLSGVWHNDWSEKPKLYQALVVFPKRETVAEYTNWNSYIDGVSSQLQLLLTAKTEKGTPNDQVQYLSQ